MSAFSFFLYFFFLSPYPLSRSERLRLRTAIMLKRCCVIVKRIPRYTIIFHGNIWPKYCLGTCVKTVPCKISNMKGVDIF